MTTGGRIKKARLQNGLSQVELAQAANVSQPTVANWENDSHIPRQHALVKLATILKASPHWLQTGIGDIPDGLHSPERYLHRPIRHVPISTWPVLADIEDGHLRPDNIRDYIALSLDVKNPFALIANDPAMAAWFPIGAAIIFNRDCSELQDGQCYLFAHEKEIILRRWQSGPDRLEALPNLSAVNADFVDQRPTPLARAVMSLRRH